jgi:predicted transcriptional regulator
MGVEKFSVLFDPELGRQVRELAEAEDETVSAFLAEAARERVRQLILKQFIADEAARLGTTPEDMAAAGQKYIDENSFWTTGKKPRRKSPAA